MAFVRETDVPHFEGFECNVLIVAAPEGLEHNAVLVHGRELLLLLDRVSLEVEVLVGAFDRLVVVEHG